MEFARSAWQLLACAVPLCVLPQTAPEAFQIESVVATTCAAESLDEDFSDGCALGTATRTTDTRTWNGALPPDPVAVSSIAAVRRSGSAANDLRGIGSAAASAAREDDVEPLDGLAGGGSSSVVITIGSSGLPAEPIELDFSITRAGISLALEDGFANAPGDDIPEAEVRMLVSCIGCDPGSAWFYQALFASVHDQAPIGFQDTLDFLDPQGLGKPAWDVTNTMPGNATAELAADFDGELDLGILEPGESFVVTLAVHARANAGIYNPAFEPFPPPPNEPKVYATAYIGEEFPPSPLVGLGLGGLPSSRVGINSVEINGRSLVLLLPEPGSTSLDLAALVAIAVLGRRCLARR
jgi:hypothetical protein